MKQAVGFGRSGQSIFYEQSQQVIRIDSSTAQQMQGFRHHSPAKTSSWKAALYRHASAEVRLH
jgi:hypothetical protein